MQTRAVKKAKKKDPSRTLSKTLLSIQLDIIRPANVFTKAKKRYKPYRTGPLKPHSIVSGQSILASHPPSLSGCSRQIGNDCCLCFKTWMCVYWDIRATLFASFWPLIHHPTSAIACSQATLRICQSDDQVAVRDCRYTRSTLPCAKKTPSPLAMCR